MVLYEDTLNQDGKHAAKHEWWAAHGVEVVRTRFDGRHAVPWSFGDYWAESATNTVVDTKASLDELASNLGRDHVRFKREVQRANADGCLLVVLVETDAAASVHEVCAWVNSHCRRCGHHGRGECDPRTSTLCLKHGTKPPLQGETMAKQMATMERNRGVRYEFARPDGSAKRICELLGVKYDD